MNKCPLIIPDQYDYLFAGPDEKYFANWLANYLVFGTRPTLTPAYWQDVAIYIRFKKRDVWTLSDRQRESAEYAIILYRIKYVIEYLSKEKISKRLNEFFAQGDYEEKMNVYQIFEQEFHATIDSLFFSQEKITVDESMLQNFDRIFAYPCWVDFDDGALEAIFDKIYQGKLSDEQIDYFLGAADDFENYDKWYLLVKHILNTTSDPHVFWVAGDILNCIWKAVPDDEASQKWIKDEIFGIFWPRVGSVWPLINNRYVNFEFDENSEIMQDAIGWLRSLDDLVARLPELGKDYELGVSASEANDFERAKRELMRCLKAGVVDREIDAFAKLVDYAFDDSTINEVRRLADEELVPAIKATNGEDMNRQLKFIGRAVKHAESYVKTRQKEGRNIAKLIKEMQK